MLPQEAVGAQRVEPALGPGDRGTLGLGARRHAQPATEPEEAERKAARELVGAPVELAVGQGLAVEQQGGGLGTARGLGGARGPRLRPGPLLLAALLPEP